ncbi:hypothetical protein ZOSMA_161G00810 [Zostera marina]|uniref:Uncharacterized protein n=1 Tax=Zostera marina TaxID=29655 RepID=A0A0K9PUH0_ZOSMR|nr:hypothetical protein ZOSMA_161G00810 [Zostera marina]
MLNLMQLKAVDLLTNQDNEEYVSDVSVTKNEDVGTPLVEIETVGPNLKDIKKLEPLNKSEGKGARIRDRLEKQRSPVDLEVENISHHRSRPMLAISATNSSSGSVGTHRQFPRTRLHFRECILRVPGTRSGKKN